MDKAGLEDADKLEAAAELELHLKCLLQGQGVDIDVLDWFREKLSLTQRLLLDALIGVRHGNVSIGKMVQSDPIMPWYNV